MNCSRRALLHGMQGYIEHTAIYVHVDLAGKRRLGLVTWINDKTTLVVVMKGAKTYDVIKRHNVKHNVRVYRSVSTVDGMELFINQEENKNDA